MSPGGLAPVEPAELHSRRRGDLRACLGPDAVALQSRVPADVSGSGGHVCDVLVLSDYTHWETSV